MGIMKIIRNIERRIMLLLLLLLSLIWSIHARWLDSSVILSFPAEIEEAYDLYSQLDQHPTWSPWLKNVKYDRAKGISWWTVSSFGLTYSWRARNVQMNSPFLIQWESLDGLPNRGKVEFTSNKKNILDYFTYTSCIANEKQNQEELKFCRNGIDVGTGGMQQSQQLTASAVGAAAAGGEEIVTMRLTISYELPEAAAVVLNALGPIGRSFIQNTLLGDLKRFRDKVQERLFHRAATAA